MKALSLNFWGQTKAWWVVLVVGILFVIGGFCYWFWPVAGFAIASQIFGWLLILAGIVQLCVSAGINRPRGWGWWIAGGVIDMFVGFCLVRRHHAFGDCIPLFPCHCIHFLGHSQYHSLMRRRPPQPLLVALPYQRRAPDDYRILLP